MTITFNAVEILEMAQQMERNGAEFYRAAAMTPAAGSRRRTLTDLAAWEDQHEKTFADMQAQAGSAGLAMEGEAALYVQALVDGHVFEPNARELLSRCHSAADVLRTAISLEKESIVFYIGIQDMVEPGLNRERLQEIIRQEMRHVSILSNELTTMGA